MPPEHAANFSRQGSLQDFYQVATRFVEEMQIVPYWDTAYLEHNEIIHLDFTSPDVLADISEILMNE
jgi:hypothetical protein